MHPKNACGEFSSSLLILTYIGPYDVFPKANNIPNNIGSKKVSFDESRVFSRSLEVKFLGYR